MHTKGFDLALLLLRLTFGGLMLINHGWGKAEKLLYGNPNQFADLFGLGAPLTLGLAVFAEVICAALLIVGLFTRWAAVPLVVTMLVAVFFVHLTDPLADKEMAILYLIPYLILGLHGAGWYSLDAQWRRG